MRWPWVGVGRLDDLREVMDARVRDAQAEAARLAEQVATLTDSLVRIQRWQHGLTETPKPERKPPEKMPMSLLDYIERFQNPSIKRDMKARAYRAHATGTSWDEIEAVIRAPREEQE